MKPIHALPLAVALSMVGAAGAGDYRKDYADLKAKVPADKMDAHLADWRVREPTNPDAWILSANWSFEQAQGGGIAITSKPAQPGGFQIVDPKTGKAVGSIGPSSNTDPARVQEATGYLRDALKRWPHRLDIHGGLAHMYQETDAWKEEMATLRTMTTSAKEHAGRLRWCHDEPLDAPEPAFLAAKLHSYAMNQYRKETPEGDAHFHEIVTLLIEACPDQAIGYNDLAAFHSLSKNNAEVQKALLRAVEVAPGDALVWANLGDNSVKLGDTAQARTAYEKVIALKPDENLIEQAKESLAALNKKKAKPKKK